MPTWRTPALGWWRSRAATSRSPPRSSAGASPRCSTPCCPTCRRAAAERAGRLLPGPLTLVLPNPGRRFAWLCGDAPERIGVRVPDLHPGLAATIDAAGGVLATSANRTGQPAPRRLAGRRPRAAGGRGRRRGRRCRRRRGVDGRRRHRAGAGDPARGAGRPRRGPPPPRPGLRTLVSRPASRWARRGGCPRPPARPRAGPGAGSSPRRGAPQRGSGWRSRRA